MEMRIKADIENNVATTVLVPSTSNNLRHRWDDSDSRVLLACEFLSNTYHML